MKLVVEFEVLVISLYIWNGIMYSLSFNYVDTCIQNLQSEILNFVNTSLQAHKNDLFT